MDELVEEIAIAMFNAVRGASESLAWDECPPISEAYRTGARAALEALAARDLLKEPV